MSASFAHANKIVVSSIAVDEELDSTGYKIGWVLDKLVDNAPEFKELISEAKVKKITSRDISGGKGFTSNVNKVEFEFENGKRWSVIFKVQTYDLIGCLDDGTELFDDIHQKECDFYELMRNVKEIPAPRIYYTHVGAVGVAGALLMQDFSDSCRTIPFHGTASVETCVDLAKVLARFQACLNHTDEKLWRGKFNVTEQVKDHIADMIKRYSPDLAEYDPSCAPLLETLKPISNKEFIAFVHTDFVKEKGWESLCHGDCHSNNILFYKNEDNSASNRIAALIDWQTPFEGNPLHDLARFCAISNDPHIRREAEPLALDAYYNELCAEYERRGSVRSVPFSRAECQKLYDYAMVAQGINLIYLVPFLNDPANHTEGAEPRVHEAQLELLALRTRLALRDTVALVKKYDLVGEFKRRSPSSN